jgi:hypothetical protein
MSSSSISVDVGSVRATDAGAPAPSSPSGVCPSALRAGEAMRSIILVPAGTVSTLSSSSSAHGPALRGRVVKIDDDRVEALGCKLLEEAMCRRASLLTELLKGAENEFSNSLVCSIYKEWQDIRNDEQGTRRGDMEEYTFQV